MVLTNNQIYSFFLDQMNLNENSANHLETEGVNNVNALSEFTENTFKAVVANGCCLQPPVAYSAVSLLVLLLLLISFATTMMLDVTLPCLTSNGIQLFAIFNFNGKVFVTSRKLMTPQHPLWLPPM